MPSQRGTSLRSAATWLDQSPLTKLAIAFAAVLGFLISSGQGLWTLYREIDTHRKQPTISIYGKTTYSLLAEVLPSQMFGNVPFPEDQNRPSTEESAWPLAYYPMQLRFSNPLNNSISLVDCRLRIKFYERSGEHESLAFFEENDFQSGLPDKVNPIIYLKSGELKRISVRFFFLLTPELGALLNDKTTQANFFHITCHDENGRELKVTNKVG
jgi:hypothetical protein